MLEKTDTTTNLIDYINDTNLEENEKCPAIEKLVKIFPHTLAGLDVNGRTPLHHAIIRNSWNIAQLLLNLGCLVNTADKDGRTPLHQAIIDNSWEIAELLLEFGGSISTKEHNDFLVIDFAGRTLLHRAIGNSSNWKLIKLLLELDCSINATDRNLQTPLHIAVKKEDSYELITLLINRGCDFNSQDTQQNTALHLAITYQNAANVRALLQASQFNINKDLPNREGHTAEQVLQNIENPQVHKKLDEAFSIRPNSLGRSPFHNAVIDNNKDLVGLLLDLGADINESDNLGMTALHLAAQCGHAMLLLFLTYQPDLKINQQDKNGNTALHHSIMVGEVDCVKKLVTAAKPIDKIIKNHKKLTAADLIKQWKNDTDRESLLKKALLSIPIINAHTLKIFDYKTTETDYLGYLRKYYKGLETSIKKKVDRRSVSMSPTKSKKEKEPSVEKISLTPTKNFKFVGTFDEAKFLKSAYGKNDSQAIANFITIAQISNDPGLLQKLKDFVNHNDEKASLLILTAFEHLQPSIAREQKKIIDWVSLFPQKLVDQGFITTCPREQINHLTIKEINKIDVVTKLSDFDKSPLEESKLINEDIYVTDEKLSDFDKALMEEPQQIDGGMDSPDKIYILTLAKICSGKLSAKSPYVSTEDKKAINPNMRVDCIINLKSVEDQILGLIDRIEPRLVISFLIKLNPKFSKIQQLQSHFIVFTLIGLWEFYGYDELNGNLFLQEVDFYIQSCCAELPTIADAIRKYEQYVLAFKSNSLNAIVQEMKPFLLKAIKPHKDSFKDKIDEFVTLYLTNAKHSLQFLCIDYIAQEISIFSAEFYRDCPLKEFLGKREKFNDESPVTEYGQSMSLITGLVKNSILSCTDPQKQAALITLWVLVEREFLHYQYARDIPAVMAIASGLHALNDDIFKKIDPHIIALKELLYKLVNMNNNFSNYRNFLKTDDRIFFLLSLLFKDKYMLHEKMAAQSDSHVSVTERLGEWALEDSDQDIELITLGKINRSIIELKKKLYDAPLEPQSDIKEQLPELVQTLELQATAAKANRTLSKSKIKRGSESNLTFFSPLHTSPDLPTRKRKPSKDDPHRQSLTISVSEHEKQGATTRTRGGSTGTKHKNPSTTRREFTREPTIRQDLPSSRLVSTESRTEMRKGRSSSSINPVTITSDEDNEKPRTLSFNE